MSDELRWIACETHAHSLHSDGRFTVDELARKSRELGLECLVLSDHNTISGHAEIPEASSRHGLGIVRAMEWTTFYGHLLVLGCGEYLEWRDLGPADIREGLARVHRAGAVAGIAHPFRPGSPFCSGCFWQFESGDFSGFDYLEVWSEPSPHKRATNRRAFALWDSLLSAGLRIPGLAARDWHGERKPGERLAVTWLGLDREPAGQEDLEACVKQAIRAGRVSVSLGPLLLCRERGQSSGARERGLSPQRIELEVEVDASVRPGQWSLDPASWTIEFASNLGPLGAWPCPDSGKLNLELPRQGLAWLRAELRGLVDGEPALIAFANPLYLD